MPSGSEDNAGTLSPHETSPTRTRLYPPTSDSAPANDRGRSITPQNRDMAPSFRDSSQSRADRLKSFGKFVKQKGQHLRAKSEALLGKYTIPSPPALSSQEENDQRMTEEFAELAVEAPPTATTSAAAADSASSSLSPQAAENSEVTGAPPVRRTSFRHEHYPRRPLVGSPDGSSESTPVFVPDSGSHADVKIPALLQQGTPMLKISTKNIKTRVFRIDPKLGQIRWDSNSAGIAPLDTIKEVRCGPETRFYREQFRISPDKEDLWLTIVYTSPSSKYKTLHLIAFTPDIFNLWKTTLQQSVAYRTDLLTGAGSLDPVQKHILWERQYWNDAERSGDHAIDFEEILGMCRRLNISLPQANLLNVFIEADSEGRGRLNFADFRHFVALMKARPDIQTFYETARGHDEFMFSVFERFMKESQKSTLATPELIRLFEKFANLQEPQSSSALPGPGVISPPRVSTPPPPHAVSNEKSPERSLILSTPSPRPGRETRLGRLQRPLSEMSGSLTPSASPSRQMGRDVPTPTPIIIPTTTWSLASFTSFLLSSDNSVFQPFDSNSRVHHDMSRPLCEYFISSSHNTYLVGNQLVGSSTVEGYIRALLSGCRSVEIDIWDGDDSPVIYHGRTLTSKVPLASVCQAIYRYAFVASPYPIIISAEVHCNLRQQDMAADIMKREFGDTLITEPLAGDAEAEGGIKELPSPERLKGKILLKTKGVKTKRENTETSAASVPMVVDSSTSTAEESTGEYNEFKQELREEFAKAQGLVRKAKDRLEDLESNSTELAHLMKIASIPLSSSPPSMSPPPPPPKSSGDKKISFELAALLIYTVGVKCRGFNKKVHYAPEHMFSLSEGTANKIVKESMGDLIKHCRTHLVRLYPSGTRLNSSNYEPLKYWAGGVQLVAINWQTPDLGQMMNFAMFQRNGRSGYVLKPEPLRIKDKEMAKRRTKHFLDITIISAQQLPLPKASLKNSDKEYMLDPFVEVSLHVPDWSTSPFLPDDAKFRIAYSPPSSTKDNGIPIRPSYSNETPPDSNIASTSYSSPSSTARTLSQSTSVVKNNGFSPHWNERMSFPFDCVGDRSMMDLIFLKLQVKDAHNYSKGPTRKDSGSTGGTDVAVFCAPLGSLRPGLRHLPLHDKQMSQFLFSTLFVQLDIRDVS